MLGDLLYVTEQMRLPLTRSEIMSRVRSKGTEPEMRVRRAFHAAGLRYSLHKRGMPGTPDMVLRRHRMVVFVNGCFWHGHDCPRGRIPKTNTAFWKAKIERNRSRDAWARRELEAAGWRVLTIWECETRAPFALHDYAVAIAYGTEMEELDGPDPARGDALRARRRNKPRKNQVS